MITEMVITITDSNIKSNTTIQLTKILIYITTVLENEVHDIEISVSSESVN